MRLFCIPWKTGKYFSRPWLSEALHALQDSKINYTNAYVWFPCKILTGVHVKTVAVSDMALCNLINCIFPPKIGIYLPNKGTYSRRPTAYANVSKVFVRIVEFTGLLFKEMRDAIISINPGSSDFSIVWPWIRFQWMPVMLTRICEMPSTLLRIFYYIYD